MSILDEDVSRFKTDDLYYTKYYEMASRMMDVMRVLVVNCEAVYTCHNCIGRKYNIYSNKVCPICGYEIKEHSRIYSCPVCESMTFTCGGGDVVAVVSGNHLQQDDVI